VPPGAKHTYIDYESKKGNMLKCDANIGFNKRCLLAVKIAMRGCANTDRGRQADSTGMMARLCELSARCSSFT
jgi:hypothetical protein